MILKRVFSIWKKIAAGKAIYKLNVAGRAPGLHQFQVDQQAPAGSAGFLASSRSTV